MSGAADPGEEFAQRAREYCALIEAPGDLSRQEFLGKALLTLSRLYAAGLHLPVGDCTAKYEKQGLSHQQWEALFHSLGQKLGEFRSYWEFFSPRFKDEPVAGDLADDLADIYGDVKSGLEPFERESAAVRESVVWHWRVLLGGHWGHHATGRLVRPPSLLQRRAFPAPVVGAVVYFSSTVTPWMRPSNLNGARSA